MPHSTLLCPQWDLCTDHEDGLDGLLRKLVIPSRPILVYTSLPFACVSGLLGGLLCGKWQILVFTAPPWHHSDLSLLWTWLSSSLPDMEPIHHVGKPAHYGLRTVSGLTSGSPHPIFITRRYSGNDKLNGK